VVRWVPTHGSHQMEEGARGPGPTFWAGTTERPGHRAALDVRLPVRVLSGAHVLRSLRGSIHRPPAGRRARGLLETARLQSLRADARAAHERVRDRAAGRGRTRSAPRRLAAPVTRLRLRPSSSCQEGEERTPGAKSAGCGPRPKALDDAGSTAFDRRAHEEASGRDACEKATGREREKARESSTSAAQA
jgi:hypothetical protein